MAAKQTTKLAAGWIQDATTLLWHFYQEQPGLAAHPPLCEGPVMLTQSVRLRAGVRPEGLATTYGKTKNRHNTAAAICQACANRHAKLRK